LPQDALTRLLCKCKRSQATLPTLSKNHFTHIPHTFPAPESEVQCHLNASKTYSWRKLYRQEQSLWKASRECSKDSQAYPHAGAGLSWLLRSSASVCVHQASVARATLDRPCKRHQSRLTQPMVSHHAGRELSEQERQQQTHNCFTWTDQWHRTTSHF